MHYAIHSLDRADHLRKDDTALSQMFENPSSRFYPVYKGDSLVQRFATPKQTTTAVSISKPAHLSRIDVTFLGLDESSEQRIACFAFSCSDYTDTQLQQLLDLAPSGSEFLSLRTVGPLIDNFEGSILAYAKALTGWHDTIKYCEHCGNSLITTAGGHVKKCRSCERLQFPRTDPAVIMLVERAATSTTPAQCLLGRNRNWPEGVFSTLAGFVEPGESLEHAVMREVYEESNIKTSNVQYIASQPWPFPRSIMLGFIATAESSEITCDPNELEEAHWFDAQQIKSFGTWGDESDGHKLPRTDSIAFYLISQWLASQA